MSANRHGHGDLTVAQTRIPHRHRLTGVVHEQMLPLLALLQPHRRPQRLPLPVQLAVLAVPVSVSSAPAPRLPAGVTDTAADPSSATAIAIVARQRGALESPNPSPPIQFGVVGSDLGGVRGEGRGVQDAGLGRRGRGINRNAPASPCSHRARPACPSPGASGSSQADYSDAGGTWTPGFGSPASTPLGTGGTSTPPSSSGIVTTSRGRDPDLRADLGTLISDRHSLVTTSLQ